MQPSTLGATWHKRQLGGLYATNQVQQVVVVYVYIYATPQTRAILSYADNSKRATPSQMLSPQIKRDWLSQRPGCGLDLPLQLARITIRLAVRAVRSRVTAEERHQAFGYLVLLCHGIGAAPLPEFPLPDGQESWSGW
jgi:hypothetical protein